MNEPELFCLHTIKWFQSWLESNGNENILCITQNSSITETLPTDCLVSYPGLSFGGGITPQQWCSCSILQPQLTGLLLPLSNLRLVYQTK